MHGQLLLAALQSLPPQAPAAALLRHAARFPIVNSSEPTLAEITPEGAADAEALGRLLSGFSSVRLFHSPVKRCRQTAEALARGARARGIAVEEIAAAPELGADYILDLPEAGRLTDLYGEGIVRRWLRGEVPESVLVPAPRLAQIHLDFVAGKLKAPASSSRRLDLHVTHDWNILALRELALGLRHEELGWMDFLDGLAFSLSGNELLLACREHRRRQILPWTLLPATA